MRILLKDLTRIFPNRVRKKPDVHAVEHFNFEIPDGKLIGLLGPSGCGKSTMLNLICGLDTPTAGSIFFDDDEVTFLPPDARGVGIVFQNYALYPHMTVRQNITFPLGNLRGSARLTKAQQNEKALEVAKLVQIEELLDRKPRELSGGQQQRVAIARALVKMPKVLLLDEPLSNLDARLRIHTREEIKRIQTATGITTVFVTHDQEEAMSISDLIIVMKQGVMQQADAPQKVYDDPKNLFVATFLGTPPINVFEGKIKDNGIFIGDDRIGDANGLSDRDVWVAIRPEGFLLDENGTFTCDLKSVEVMGRDTSIVSTNPASQNPFVRSIISADEAKIPTSEKVRFSIKKNKLFLFDRTTEERIPLPDAADGGRHEI